VSDFEGSESGEGGRAFSREAQPSSRRPSGRNAGEKVSQGGRYMRSNLKKGGSPGMDHHGLHFFKSVE